MQRSRKILSLVVINVLIIAILLEVVLRLSAPLLPGQAGIAARWVTTGQPYAQDWNPAWRENKDHYYVLQPGINNALQYGSPSVSFQLSTIELWEGGGIGFRTDPVDFFVDAVVVGDSFGMCFTEREDCWVDQLAAQTGLGIVNLSQPVTGTTSHYRILRDFGQFYEPPLVIWQFFGNDFFDDYGLAVFNDDLTPLQDAEAIEQGDDAPLLDWFRRNSAVVAVLEVLSTGYFAGVPDGEALYVKPYRTTYGTNDEHILQFGGEYELLALDMDREQNQIGLELSREAFSNAQTLTQTWGGDLLVVLIPTREEVYASITAPIMGADKIARLASAREAMNELCDTLAIRCFDLYDAFVQRAQSGEALYYRDDMHLNAHGNAVLATALKAYLEENQE